MKKGFLIFLLMLITIIPMGVASSEDFLFEQRFLDDNQVEIQISKDNYISRLYEEIDLGLRDSIDYDLNKVDDIQRSSLDNDLVIDDDISKEIIRDDNDKIITEEVHIKKQRIEPEFKFNSKVIINTNNKINDRDIIIKENLIAVNSDNINFLNNSKYKGEVHFYVGTDNRDYKIYKDERFLDDNDLVIREGYHYKNVTSKDGYVVFNVDSFSTITIVEGDFISLYVDDYFNWANVQCVSFMTYDKNRDISYFTKQLNKASSNVNCNFDSITTDDNVGFEYTMCESFGFASIDNENPTSSGHYDFTMRAYYQENCLGGFDEQPFEITTEYEEGPTSKIQDIDDVLLVGTNTNYINLNNYFNNYNYIRIFGDGCGGWSGWKTFSESKLTHYDDELKIELYPTSSTIYLDLYSKNQNYDCSITVEASQDGESSDVSTTFLFETQTESQNVEKIQDMNDITIELDDFKSYNMNNYFNSYDSISLTIGGETKTVQLDNIGSTQSIITDYATHQLVTFSNRIEYEIYTDYGVEIIGIDSVTITALGNGSDVSTSFNVEVVDEISYEIDLLDDLVFYHKYDGDLLDSHSDIDGDGTGITFSDSIFKIGESAYIGSGSSNRIVVDKTDLGVNDIEDFSMNFWIRTVTDTLSHVVNMNDVLIYINPTQSSNNNKIALSFDDYSTPSADSIDLPSSTSQFNMISLTYDYSSKRVVFYVNGEVKVNTTVSNHPDLNDLYIGNSPALNRRYNGYIDEFLFSSKTFNQNEISTLYDIQKDGYENGSYPFEATQANPPDKINDINDKTINYFTRLEINLENYFENYNDYRLEIDGYSYFYGGNFQTEIDEYKLDIRNLNKIIIDSNDIFLDNEIIEVIVSNEDGETSSTFNLGIWNQIEQIESLPSLNLVHPENVIINLDDYFENIDQKVISYNDETIQNVGDEIITDNIYLYITPEGYLQISTESTQMSQDQIDIRVIDQGGNFIDTIINVQIDFYTVEIIDTIPNQIGTIGTTNELDFGFYFDNFYKIEVCVDLNCIDVDLSTIPDTESLTTDYLNIDLEVAYSALFLEGRFILYYEGLDFGTNSVTVTAYDLEDNSETQTFDIEIVERLETFINNLHLEIFKNNDGYLKADDLFANSQDYTHIKIDSENFVGVYLDFSYDEIEEEYTILDTITTYEYEDSNVIIKYYDETNIEEFTGEVDLETPFYHIQSKNNLFDYDNLEILGYADDLNNPVDLKLTDIINLRLQGINSPFSLIKQLEALNVQIYNDNSFMFNEYFNNYEGVRVCLGILCENVFKGGSTEIISGNRANYQIIPTANNIEFLATGTSIGTDTLNINPISTDTDININSNLIYYQDMLILNEYEQIINVVEDAVETPVISDDSLSSIFLSIFPDSEDISKPHQIIFVLLSIFISIILIFFVASETSQTHSPLLFPVMAIIIGIWIIFFTIIDYIPVWLIALIIIGFLILGSGKISAMLSGTNQNGGF